MIFLLIFAVENVIIAIWNFLKESYKNIGWNGLLYTFPYFLTFLLKRFLKERQEHSGQSPCEV